MRSATSTRTVSLPATARRMISACAPPPSAGGIDLACDTFVYHQGSVSFGDRGAAERTATKLILERYPGYAERRAIRRPGGGGPVPLRGDRGAVPAVEASRHPDGRARPRRRRPRDMFAALWSATATPPGFLLLAGTDRGSALSVPALPDHPVLMLTAERIDDLILLLRSMNLSRVHIHHLLGIDMDIRKLIRRLALPFDVTVHDYYAIARRSTCCPGRMSLYCGEPDIAGCNACIAALPSHGARDILTWRAEQAWQFIEAERVLCPSLDVLSRLQRHELAANAILAPHEAVEAGPWPVHHPRGPVAATQGRSAGHAGAKP